MPDTSLTSAPPVALIDLGDLDADIAHLDRISRVAGELRTVVALARDGLLTSAADAEMQRRARMAQLRTRATLAMLADFAA